MSKEQYGLVEEFLIKHDAPYDVFRALYELHFDGIRPDWLADKENFYAEVRLPTECVERNLDSMRHAIDDTINLSRKTPKSDA
jgi:hypothetical protein